MDQLQLETEACLAASVERASAGPCPPLLAQALQYAVFPGGARVRPSLCLAVAHANLGHAPPLACAAATAIELLHCASLVHDDMPCFDNAATRRGKPALHTVYGEPLALLVGDALIVAAFDGMALAALETGDAAACAALTAIVARGVGSPAGIVAGQAWESEQQVDVSAYHRAKTGALFVAATSAGAAAAGVDYLPWQALGERIGEAYQVADDIQDVMAPAADLDKPTGQDAALGRPSIVAERGLDGAVAYLKQLVEAGRDAVPDCPGRASLHALLEQQSRRFLPRGLGQRAA